MPTHAVDGVNINYEVVGASGPWMVLTPGGRGALEAVRYLADDFARNGYRVLIHDRRNCGASDVRINSRSEAAGTRSEQEIWADDLHSLLNALGATPVIAGGGSSGCRLSILLALRHPGSVRGLLLWWVTGGPVAAANLGYAYYRQFIDAAQAGGMTAVCNTGFFAERIRDNPANRTYLMGLAPADFCATMARWQDFFTAGAELPIIGATEAELRSLTMPTCIIPGNDEVHPQARGELLHQLLPNSELHLVRTEEEWRELQQLRPEAAVVDTGRRLRRIFGNYVQRRLAP